VNRRLGGFQSQSGRGGEEKKPLQLPVEFCALLLKLITHTHPFFLQIFLEIFVSTNWELTTTLK
jgi:hypothetical protein